MTSARVGIRQLSRIVGLAGLVLLSAAGVAAEAGDSAASAMMSRAVAVVDSDSARLEAVFKDIHQHPELGFMETRTAAIVAKELRALGFQVQTGIGKTGVVGVLKNGAGPTVMYRADMDANAVEEATGLPYASKLRARREDGSESPVGHMCGHDAHVTWMLGMAKALVALPVSDRITVSGLSDVLPLVRISRTRPE